MASEDEAKITWRYNIERGLAPKTTKFEGKISIKLFFCPEESEKSAIINEQRITLGHGKGLNLI